VCPMCAALGSTSTPPPGSATAPANQPASAAANGLVGRAKLQDIATPRLDLSAAISDPAFASRDPATLRVPAELMTAIGAAKKVLLVSHVTPDADGAGSSLAVGRALKALGKEVDICVDDEIPGGLRAMDRDRALKRAKDLAGKSWDLALVIDVSVPGRIALANTELLKHAKTVAIVDHHVSDPKATDFDLAPGTTFMRWLEPDWPAAALMAGAIVGKLTPQLKAARADLTQVLTPALVGFGTDSGWGSYQGIDSDYFRYFKGMLLDQAQTTLTAVRNVLEGFKLPQRVWDLGVGVLKPVHANLPATLQQKLESLAATGQAVGTFSANNAAGKPGLAIATATAAYVDALLEVGRLNDPQLITLDALSPFKYGRLKQMQKDGYALSAFLRSTPDGAVHCEFRSGDDTALKVALFLGGGGHDRAAGAHIADATLASIRDRIIAWARQEGVII
jgi:nanoRNase/pAp phosphatase (c-di-AMP/oligoRNAs hydrolase)